MQDWYRNLLLVENKDQKNSFSWYEKSIWKYSFDDFLVGFPAVGLVSRRQQLRLSGNNPKDRPPLYPYKRPGKATVVFCLSVRPFVCLFFRLSVRPFVCLSVFPSVCPSVCLSVFSSVCPSVCLSVFPFVCLFFCLCVRFSVCLSVFPSVCPSVCLSFSPFLFMSVHLPAPAHLSVHLQRTFKHFIHEP